MHVNTNEYLTIYFLWYYYIERIIKVNVEFEKNNSYRINWLVGFGIRMENDELF